MWLPIRKHPQPVVVARHSRFNQILLGILLSFSSWLWAETNPHHIALIHAHTPEELSRILDQAEAWADARQSYPEQAIALVLHGNEANAFVKHNYQMYRALVDKAAKLDAFNVVDIKICETWMGINRIRRDQLPAFVDTVPFGPAEEERLIESGYQQF